MRRTIGSEFIRRATANVRVIGKNDSPSTESQTTTLHKLTPLSQLDREFPRSVPGTPYHHFATTKDEHDRVAVIVDQPSPAILEQAIQEAALGLMDNPLCR